MANSFVSSDAAGVGHTSVDISRREAQSGPPNVAKTDTTAVTFVAESTGVHTRQTPPTSDVRRAWRGKQRRQIPTLLARTVPKQKAGVGLPSDIPPNPQTGRLTPVRGALTSALFRSV